MLPVTQVRPEDEAALEDYPVQSDLINKIARDAAKGAVGCPVGVQVGNILKSYHKRFWFFLFQVVGKHYQEEMVLHVMELIERLLSNKQ